MTRNLTFALVAVWLFVIVAPAAPGGKDSRCCPACRNGICLMQTKAMGHSCHGSADSSTCVMKAAHCGSEKGLAVFSFEAILPFDSLQISIHETSLPLHTVLRYYDAAGPVDTPPPRSVV